ncbi:MAG: VTT domain-containing protein [Nakamurella sp.]
MPSWLVGRPFAITFAVLFGIVLLRAQATYWAGRGASAGARHTSLQRRLDGPKMIKTIAVLNKWGLPIITVSFVTVGFQTVVNAAAGLTRMRWGRYTAAMLPGCAAWALLYATVVFAAFTAWINLRGAWKWAGLAAILLVALGGVAIAIHVRAVRIRAAAAASGAAMSSGAANPAAAAATGL